MVVVLLYFLLILLLGLKVSRNHRNDDAHDFLTGGRQMGWFRTSMTLIATSINVGIIGVVGIGFVWGMAIQPNAVNLWFAAPLAAMFFIPIFWRTQITTTPELLEKRFNVSCRSLFSILMTLFNIILLGTSIYLGGFMLQYFFGWKLYESCFAIIFIVALMNISGGMKAILTIDFYQGIFISITFLIIGSIILFKIGGIKEFMNIRLMSKAGSVLPSTLLHFDLSPFSTKWYSMPLGLIWAIFAGTSWTACNFSMVQRLLAAKNENQAQKAVIFTAFCGVLAAFIAYFIGVSVRSINPELIHPDQAYLFAILHYIPLGFRGLIIVGMVASLVSSINGLMTSSTTMVIQDFFLRFLRPNANSKSTIRAARLVQVIILIVAALLIPLSAKEETITRLIQDLISIPLGIIFSLYVLAVFSTKITPKAAYWGTISGIIISLIIFFFLPNVNFWNRGVVGSITVILVAIVLSFFEKQPTSDKLENLTVFTFKGSKSPFIGKKAWRSILWWIISIQLSWLLFTVGWEMLIQ